ncbi:MAG: TerC family protein [Fimbriimonadaceae bacterium]|nr:TerC family protein [Fimbriimonadaceae bacterium]
MTPQSFQFGDLGIVAFLVVLEALLSADNALVLAIMVKHLPSKLQRKALLYGLGGAFIFRFVAILFATTILSLWWLQAIGAVYLLFLPIKHFWSHSGGEKKVQALGKGFWPTVIAVEITDIAFAVDSVLAGVALVKSPSKIWVVYFGAIIGVILLRFAATLFISLLEKYPLLDHVAYVLVGWVGVKLSFMAGHNFGVHHDKTNAVPLTWRIPELPQVVFWGVLTLICVIGGWLAVKKAPPRDEMTSEVLVEDDRPTESATP